MEKRGKACVGYEKTVYEEYAKKEEMKDEKKEEEDKRRKEADKEKYE